MGGKLVKQLKANPNNPRTITQSRLGQLGKSMGKYGDLSGIVFNIRSGNLVAGHQRAKNFDADSEITYLKKLSKPDYFGTVAYGYILHQGTRFNYREVDWDQYTETGAMLAANKNAGDWDMHKVNEQLRALTSFDADFDMEHTMYHEDELRSLGIDLASDDTSVVQVMEHERGNNGGEKKEKKAQCILIVECKNQKHVSALSDEMRERGYNCRSI